MSGQIVCHIGPPKTATTSLQIALESVQREDFLFIGTFQPRDRNAGSLSQRLHAICASKADNERLEQKALVAELKAEVNSGKTVLISEEMFLVHQGEAESFEKIHALSEVLSGLPCRVIMTARDPNSALPSYFQEIFSSLPVNMQMDFSKFCRDRRAACFDYENLIASINKSGFKDVAVIDFDRLSAGRISLGELTGKIEHVNVLLPLGTHNSGLLGTSPTSRLVPEVTLKNLGRARAVKRMIEMFRLRRWRGYRHFVAQLDRIALRSAAHRDLIVPADVAERLDAGYQRIRQRFFETNV